MRVECFAATRPQEGRTANEDAFLIGREPIPCAGLCDGAGNAQLAARRALALFERLLRDSTPEQACSPATWGKWVKLLDSSLLGGSQSTFLGIAIVDGIAVGACAGDSRAYLMDREGGCRILTEGAAKHRLGSGSAGAFPLRQDMRSGDMLLLMSDGAWTPLGGPYLLRKAVASAAMRYFSEVPGAVLDAASRAGRTDDMTCVAIRLTGFVS